MNRITRMLTMTGIGVFTAVSVGAAPAMATTGGSQTPAKSASPAAKGKLANASRARIVDIYPSRGSCHFAGRLGERRGDWDDYICYRTRGGYALQVSFDSWGRWNDWDNSDWRGPWGIHGIVGFGGNFRGNGGGFRDNRGGGFRDDRDFRFRGNGGGFRFRDNRGGFRFRGNGGFRPRGPGGAVGAPAPGQVGAPPLPVP